MASWRDEPQEVDWRAENEKSGYEHATPMTGPAKQSFEIAGWHSLRRRFASDLMHVPLKTLCELGEWKSPQTVLTCYQHPDQQRLRAALLDRSSASTGV